ncbi:MAG: gamma-glutamyl-gamma-aminobutyrate hydrolase family protein [Eggerthellaceae bacterium]|nr:gamma-glutamyl-gamma-aminobutyrate hydrolase family protein [Eggerthellaceae bacterium]
MPQEESAARIRALNRQNLIDYFEKGEKSTRTLGFELEHIILHAGTGRAVSYSEPGGIRDVLERLSACYDEVLYDGEDIVGCVGPREVVTIEPAGQIEVSLGPCTSVFDVERLYLGFRDKLDPILEEFGLETPMLGYNPAARADDLELIPKFRYECMTKFLGAQAHEGICMMRGSGSLQISIDYRDEADAARKMRIGAAIGPILALICDNSPFFEAEERTHELVRTAIWSGMKQDRTGVAPGSLSAGYTFADYADYILSREAILVPDADADNGWRYVGSQTFDEVYAERPMTEAELEHALSMVWPDMRLKNFIEIRPADAMPLEYALAYVVLVRALFYSDRNLAMLDSLLASVTEDDVARAKAALIEKGYGAQIYGRQAEFWADLLMVLASGSFEEGEESYLEPLATMVRYRTTLADIWPRLMEKRAMEFTEAGEAPVIGVVPRYDFEWTGLAIGDGYLSGLLEAGAIPIVLPATHDPVAIRRLVAACDGFLVPGGQDIDPKRYGKRRAPHTHRSATARDKMEDALIRAAVAADKPVLGVCRGMQSINVALGGTLHQDIHAEQSPDSLAHVQGRPFDMPAHMVDVAEGSLLARCVGAPRLGVNTIHHQSVAELGEGLVVSAVSPDDGVIEGIEMPGKRFVLGVQWHPEHMWRTRPHSKRLFRAFIQAAKGRR